MSTVNSYCNCINRIESVPLHFKCGVIVPIDKPGKDSIYKDNNLYIIKGTLIGKIWQNLLMLRFMPWARQQQVIDELQVCSNQGCSSLHNSWLVSERVSYNLERGSDVYVVLLDIKKAFDSVWIDGLMYRLFEIGIDLKLWKLMEDLYSDAECCVKIGGRLLQWFTISQGVHEWAPLTMMLFQVFMNRVIKEIKCMKIGAGISNIHLPCSTLADDLSLIALSIYAMQRMLNTALYFSKKWRFEFSAPNSYFLMYSDIDTEQMCIL